MDIAHRQSSLAKGEWGKLLIIAGSIQFAGAAVLATRAALRTGADIVIAAAPERAANAVLHAAPDAISLAIPARHFDKNHLKYLKHFITYPVALGSGLMTGAAVKKFVKAVLKSFKGPFVIDADALRFVAAEKHPAKLWKGKRVILTPNRAEYALLAGKQSAHPLQTIKELAKRHQAVILCKGPTDIVSDGERVEEISGGSPFLAKAGTGDALTGVVAALLARGLSPFEAAVTGSRLLKQTSERVERERGAGLLAMDVAEALDTRQLKDPRVKPEDDRGKQPAEQVTVEAE